MELKRNVEVLFFFIVLNEVAPWTVDLPEVRKYVFQKHKKEMEISKNEYEDHANRDKIIYNNAQVLKEHEKYAAKFGYQSYMEKKVEEIVHDGSSYLEGLRRSLENFNRFLEDCNKRNISRNSSIFNSTVDQSLSSNATKMEDFQFTSGFNDTSPTANLNNNFIRLSTLSQNVGMSCHQATEVSERVRRYAHLATWTTRRLQDLAYAGKYQPTDQYEENELILKLAWFLDQLAVLTGYEPQRKPYLASEAPAPSTSPTPPTLVPQNQELVDSLINCIKVKSPIPATIRCQYNLPLPEMAQQIIGGTSTRSPELTLVPDVIPTPTADSSPQQSKEILIAADDFRKPRSHLSKRSPNPDEYYVPIPVYEKPKPIVDFIVKKFTNLKEIVKSVKKHAVADFASQVALHKHIHKRSIDDNSSLLVNKLSNTSKPSVKFNGTIVKYVLQHLPITDVSIINTKSFKKRSINEPNVFNFINDLSIYKSNVKSVNKRSIDDPFSTLFNYFIKYKIWDSSNPSQIKNDKKQSNFDVNNNLQTKIVAKRSLFYKKNRHLLPKQITETPKTKIYPKQQKNTAMIHEKKHKNVQKKSHKLYKRSLIYEDMYLPRIPFNPMRDISYYTKSKEGHNFQPSLTQAAQVRLGLQQVFETGNIEVVHRYGANYNPAVPAPFYTGVIKGTADN